MLIPPPLRGLWDRHRSRKRSEGKARKGAEKFANGSEAQLKDTAEKTRENRRRWEEP